MRAGVLHQVPRGKGKAHGAGGVLVAGEDGRIEPPAVILEVVAAHLIDVLPQIDAARDRAGAFEHVLTDVFPALIVERQETSLASDVPAQSPSGMARRYVCRALHARGATSWWERRMKKQRMRPS